MQHHAIAKARLHRKWGDSDSALRRDHRVGWQLLLDLDPNERRLRLGPLPLGLLQAPHVDLVLSRVPRQAQPRRLGRPQMSLPLSFVNSHRMLLG